MCRETRCQTTRPHTSYTRVRVKYVIIKKTKNTKVHLLSINLVFRLNIKIRMEEGHISDKRGRKLKTFTWMPDGDVKGLVFLSHGCVFDVLFFGRLITF